MTYIIESAAQLSPESQDRIIIAIEQLLGYAKKQDGTEPADTDPLNDMQPDAY